MKLAKWMVGGALACCLFFGQNALAQGNSEGHGHGKGHDKDKHGDDDRDEDRGYYHGHDKEVHDWYYARGNNLPPGPREERPPATGTRKATGAPRNAASRVGKEDSSLPARAGSLLPSAATRLCARPDWWPYCAAESQDQCGGGLYARGIVLSNPVAHPFRGEGFHHADEIVSSQRKPSGLKCLSYKAINRRSARARVSLSGGGTKCAARLAAGPYRCTPPAS